MDTIKKYRRREQDSHKLFVLLYFALTICTDFYAFSGTRGGLVLLIIGGSIGLMAGLHIQARMNQDFVEMKHAKEVDMKKEDILPDSDHQETSYVEK